MIGVTLKQLRYFDALARRLHFARAADDCAISQPALSMQIQDLEQRLGVTLVERTRAGVQLTSAGVEVARRAARVLADVRDLVDSVRLGAQPLMGPLRLGVIPTVAPYLLPPMLPLLRESYPGCELHLRETQTSVLLRELAGGELDALFLALPVDAPDVQTLALFQDRFLLALPSSVEPPSGELAMSALLGGDRLLLLEEGHCLRDQALDFCGQHRVRAVNTLGAASLSTIVQMVANGYGVTLLPESCLDVEVWRGSGGRDERTVRLVKLAGPEPFRTLGLAWRATSPRRSDFEALGKLIAAVWDQRARRP
jgi:LysR family transcriptional regulator, hydrogen peroxide-inducible genes activator